LRFNPLTQDQVSSYLRERLALPPEEADTLASACGGSVERAIQLREDDYLTVRKEIMDYLAEGREINPLNTLFFINFIARDKKNLFDKLEVLKSCFRDAMVYRELKKKEGLINSDREDTILAIVKRVPAKETINNLRIIDRLTRALEYNANKTLTLEAAVFKLAL
ncbi:MAG: DNA polymerase III subunit delta' C-terminal domain-containing protein, partial [Syntrophales bacterium]|nr:DNA polymerase III subunit delta' C-terminal domain-containing protein [Syntrophales bacterium]